MSTLHQCHILRAGEFTIDCLVSNKLFASNAEELSAQVTAHLLAWPEAHSFLKQAARSDDLEDEAKEHCRRIVKGEAHFTPELANTLNNDLFEDFSMCFQSIEYVELTLPNVPGAENANASEKFDAQVKRLRTRLNSMNLQVEETGRNQVSLNQARQALSYALFSKPFEEIKETVLRTSPKKANVQLPAVALEAPLHAWSQAAQADDIAAPFGEQKLKPGTPVWLLMDGAQAARNLPYLHARELTVDTQYPELVALPALYLGDSLLSIIGLQINPKMRPDPNHAEVVIELDLWLGIGGRIIVRETPIPASI